MKNSKQLLSILIMLFLSISLYGQFKAKMAMKSPAESPISMGNDPLKSFEHYKEITVT